MHAFQETGRFGDSTFFHHSRLGLFTVPSIRPSRAAAMCDLQTGLRLSSVRDGDPPRFVLSVREFFNSLFPRQYRMMWTNSMACWNHFHFSSLEKTSEVYSFMLWKSMTSATYTNECRMELRYSVQHLEFSSESGSSYFLASQAVAIF